jgi:hypothetical protein
MHNNYLCYAKEGLRATPGIVTTSLREAGSKSAGLPMTFVPRPISLVQDPSDILVGCPQVDNAARN